MGRRLQFHQILVTLLESNNVYFQPPSGTKMKYPCIVYSLSRASTKRANNQLYGAINGYLVTVIDPDPDSEIPDKILALPMSSFDRHFTADDLNHFVYNVYY